MVGKSVFSMAAKGIQPFCGSMANPHCGRQKVITNTKAKK
jgi:hypothetical protein